MKESTVPSEHVLDVCDMVPDPVTDPPIEYAVTLLAFAGYHARFDMLDLLIEEGARKCSSYHVHILVHVAMCVVLFPHYIVPLKQHFLHHKIKPHISYMCVYTLVECLLKYFSYPVLASRTYNVCILVGFKIQPYQSNVTKVTELTFTCIHACRSIYLINNTVHM